MEEMVTNEQGGRQSHVAERMDLIPAECQLLLAQCLGFGAEKYGPENWHRIPIDDHLNHALVHLTKWRAGDRSEPHLVNAMARINFATWCAVQSGDQPREYRHPDQDTNKPPAMVQAPAGWRGY